MTMIFVVNDNDNDGDDGWILLLDISSPFFFCTVRRVLRFCWILFMVSTAFELFLSDDSIRLIRFIPVQYSTYCNQIDVCLDD